MGVKVGDIIEIGGNRQASGYNLIGGGCIFSIANHLGSHLKDGNGEINGVSIKNFDYFRVPGTDITFLIARK